MMKELRASNIIRNRQWDPTHKIDLEFRINELIGEVGEACNILKKLERETLGLPGSRALVADLIDEFADIIICADLSGMTINGATPFDDELCTSDTVSIPFGRARWGIVFGRMIGQISQDVIYKDRQSLTSNLGALIQYTFALARRCGYSYAQFRGIIIDKFNATSEKNGLAERMAS